jgi:hypothetical protein
LLGTNTKHSGGDEKKNKAKHFAFFVSFGTFVVVLSDGAGSFFRISSRRPASPADGRPSPPPGVHCFCPAAIISVRRSSFPTGGHHFRPMTITAARRWMIIHCRRAIIISVRRLSFPPAGHHPGLSAIISLAATLNSVLEQLCRTEP